MRREFRKLLIATLFVVPVAMVTGPGLARAGISVEGKVANMTTSSLYGNQAELVALNVVLAARGSSGGSSTTDESGTNAATPPKRRGPGEPVMLISSEEYAQIEQGLITEEEALSGCGASVTGGPASLGALALVGLFLALRRRK